MIPFLELRNVTKVFGSGLIRKKRTVALDNISFAVDAENPSVRAVAGESGSGKSTLGLILMGFLRPTSGQVLYNGKDLTKLSAQERKNFRREVQAVFQDPFSVYNPFYKVDHVLHVPIEKFNLAASKSERTRLIEDALTNVGLRPDETLGRYPHELSGGQRQRIMVARALLMKPRLIIADEPVSMVDASLRATILESLSKLNRELGISIMYITHDLTTAYHVSDDILVLYQGSIAEAGDVSLVIKEPQHPYTQLLVNSIPWPDLERKWNQTEMTIRKGEQNGVVTTGCKFANRCPHLMSICQESAPLLYQTNPQRAASCYLYQESPPLANQDVSELKG
ncbi:ABC transporter ATP-binding protein [Chloroflexi bacterium TSY]|nr:ABC transporter ATP-binding protein [Chloroflexi bacterium TSY]